MDVVVNTILIAQIVRSEGAFFCAPTVFQKNATAKLNHTGDSTFFTLDGGTLKTSRVFDSSVKSSYTLRLRATNAAGFSTEKDVTINIAKQAAVTPVTTYLVTSTADTNTAGTLRYALTQANSIVVGVANIKFDASVFATPQTINILSALPNITNSAVRVQILGPGSSLLTINGGGASSDYSAFTVSNYDTKATISGMTIANFRRTSDGAAIKSYGQLTVDDVAFKNNTSVGSWGGAIYSQGSSSVFLSGNVQITNSAFTGNIAVNGGAIATSSAGSATISKSTFSSNTASGKGAALYFAATGLTLENDTITNNTAASGGGVYDAGSSGTLLQITSSTIAGNTATASVISGTSTTSAGGLQVVNDSATIKVFNTIIAKNMTASASNDVVGSIDASSGNLIGNGANMSGLTNGVNGNQVGTNASPIDPLLDSLANNGGTTQTMALLAGSPAIDAGDSSATTTDQRGTTRSQGARANIGAFELVTANAAPAITTQPVSASSNSGTTASFSVAGTATPAATAQWYVSSDKGQTWSAISGATSTTYSLTTAAADNGKQYRAVLTNSVGSVTSSPASLTVNFAPTLNSQPANASVNALDTVAFRVGYSASPAPAIQWQASSNSGSTWTNIPGATTDYYLITALGTDNAKQFRAVLTNSVGSVTTAAASLSVTSQLTLGNANDDVAPVTGLVYDGGITNDNRPTFQGTNTPLNTGDTVQIFDGTTKLGNAVVSGTTWSFTPAAAMTQATHSIIAKVVTSTGAVVATTTAFTITIDTRAPTTAVAITNVVDDAGAVANNGTTDDTTPTLGGTLGAATAGASLAAGDTLQVFDNGVFIGLATVSTVAGGQSTWTFTPTTPLANGKHTITVRVVDAAGNAGTLSVARVFTIA